MNTRSLFLVLFFAALPAALVPHEARAQSAMLTTLGGSLGGSSSGYGSESDGITNDGGVAVGDAITAGGQDHTFRWTPTGGMVDIDTTGTGSNSNSNANGVSADGNVVVSAANFGNAGSNQNAYRWTQATGMVDIDTTGTGIQIQTRTASPPMAMQWWARPISAAATQPPSGGLKPPAWSILAHWEDQIPTLRQLPPPAR